MQTVKCTKQVARANKVYQLAALTLRNIHLTSGLSPQGTNIRKLMTLEQATCLSDVD